MLSKLLVLKNVVAGYLYKWLVDSHLFSIPSLPTKKKAEGRYIVSLTSYGRRVKTSVVYYSIVSILRQSMPPDHIVLCLDKTLWNDGNLPPKLKKLKHKGLEVLYCEDMRSYTKLIPSLKKYPNDYIITVDDDIIYTRDTIERLTHASNKTPDAICCLNASKPIIKNGYAAMYENWMQYKKNTIGYNLIFPCGVGGVLYPPHSLDLLAMDDKMFKKLCPYADDVWFWYCGMLKQTLKHVVYKHKSDYSFDALYQYFHRGTALTHSNRYEHQNDNQIRTVFDYFGVRLDKDGYLVKNTALK
ncbi:glycosyltransferase family 2 protein [Caecibacteroides pullorum]|uniref:Glycosyltransferase family 2 protein n=1 Tax=Caecibacteroides pullorum TaxID=2725562 RepID=A0AA40ZR48_9BACT|nr:glycosyltransferase family 2 protein [Caecibacteroides pullorum]MBM6856393.1 glycosyltransferase family 2 protein [Caecibacteroides pullorum]MBV8057400.1 glycosyltransferase family 2 protein [Caecibacteroides pullorum]